jgi:hypothetical protein
MAWSVAAPGLLPAVEAALALQLPLLGPSCGQRQSSGDYYSMSHRLLRVVDCAIYWLPSRHNTHSMAGQR